MTDGTEEHIYADGSGEIIFPNGEVVDKNFTKDEIKWIDNNIDPWNQSS